VCKSPRFPSSPSRVAEGTVPSREQIGHLGAIPRRDGLADFRVWAPNADAVAVRLPDGDHRLTPEDGGVFAAAVPAQAGDGYLFVVDDEAFPDPCSRAQPLGVPGPSQILDTNAFEWTDDGWSGLHREELVIYELHVGTFSAGGTFDGVRERLAELADLGVTAIELMPVATFPGERNWGYDGLYVFAPHPVYGGPSRLAALVDAAHHEGLGVILDVVYNHIGPGSETVSAFGPYFTDRESTPWGDALDYRERGVREWAIQNAELWIGDYHVDGLRLDATHAVYDDSDPHVLAELAARVHALDPRALVISEMSAGDLRPIEAWGHDAQWADEFHHVLHVLLTGEREGYYADYAPSVEDLGLQLEREPASKLVFCSQNHDQVGNRALGDRPARGELRIRAAALLLAPQIVHLFMGEEYGEQRPFQFFTDHRDPAIAEATRSGRRREFESFSGHRQTVPDPQAAATFEASKLDPGAGDPGLRAFYRELLGLRRRLPRAIAWGADESCSTLTLRRGDVELTLDFRDRGVELTGR
jgi:maltooligosyltrehalose trehalohydrolase